MSTVNPANQGVLPPIPWSFDPAEGGVFLWSTKLFRAVIASGGPTSFFWEVGHESADGPVPIQSGSLGSFAEAESAVRETIGKAYPPNSGYRRFAGDLATTFQIADGSFLDFGPLEYATVMVSVQKGDGATEMLTGELRVANFFITLDGHDRHLIRIVPSHITEVRRMNGVKPPTSSTPKSSIRMAVGTVHGGCTGRAGFIDGTVDHFGARACPVHEGRQSS